MAASESSDVSLIGIIKDVAGQMRRGVELHRITLPAQLFQPMSLLQKLANNMSRGQFFLRAVDEDDPVQRFLLVLRGQIGGLRGEPQWAKKPFNPVLGECMTCWWDHGSDNRTIFLAEQVSHHPPVSAFHLANESKGLLFDAELHEGAKLHGNSVSILLHGPQTLRMLTRGETYHIVLPHLCVRGLLVGERRTEWAGELSLRCDETGLLAQVKYQSKPAFGGAWDRVHGRVLHRGQLLYTLDGVWSDCVYMTDARTQERVVFLRQADEPFLRATHPRPDALDERHSLAVWRAAIEAIRARDFAAAARAKQAVEDAQRARRKAGTDYAPRFFAVEGSRWMAQRDRYRAYVEAMVAAGGVPEVPYYGDTPAPSVDPAGVPVSSFAPAPPPSPLSVGRVAAAVAAAADPSQYGLGTADEDADPDAALIGGAETAMMMRGSASGATASGAAADTG